MKKRLVGLTLACLLFAATAFAFPADRVIIYYNDWSRIAVLGIFYEPGSVCPESESSSEGTTSNFREVTTFSECGYQGTSNTICQEYSNGAWHTVDCE